MSTADAPTRPPFFDRTTRTTIGVVLLIVLVEAVGNWNVRSQAVLQLLTTSGLFAFGAVISRQIVTATDHKAMKSFWTVVLVGLAARSCADAVQAVTTVVLRGPHPELQTALSKGIHGLALLILVRAFLFYPLGAKSRQERTRLVLDLCTILLVICGLGWYFILAPSFEGPATAKTILIAFAQFGLLLVYANFFRLLVSNTSPLTRRSNLIALSAAAFFGTAELIAPLFVDTAHAHWIFVARIGALLCQHLTLRSQLHDVTTLADPWTKRRRRPFNITPYTSIAALYAVLGVALVKSHALNAADWGLFASAVLSTGVVIARQLSAFTDNAALLGQLNRSLVELQESYEREQESHRVREALEAELRHTQKLEALGRLAGGVAHEINTPVQYLRDNLAFVADSITEMRGAVDGCIAGHHVDPTIDLSHLDELPAALQDMTSGLERVSRIAQSLQSIGAEEGSTPSMLCDVRETLTGAVAALGAPGASIDLQVPAGMVVRGNARNLGQAWAALLENALQAIEETGRPDGELRVVARSDGSTATIEVIDNGCGMDPDIVERAFDPFFTTKPVGSGTGQGLTVARSIVVDGHSGTIDLESRPGVGTTARVTLPVAVGSGRDATVGGSDERFDAPLDVAPSTP